MSAALSLVDCQLSHWSTATAARQPGTGVSQARFPHLHLDLDQLLQDFLGIVLFLYSHPTWTKVKWLVEIYVIKPQSRLIRYFLYLFDIFSQKEKEKYVFFSMCVFQGHVKVKYIF